MKGMRRPFECIPRLERECTCRLTHSESKERERERECTNQRVLIVHVQLQFNIHATSRLDADVRTQTRLIIICVRQIALFAFKLLFIAVKFRSIVARKNPGRCYATSSVCCSLCSLQVAALHFIRTPEIIFELEKISLCSVCSHPARAKEHKLSQDCTHTGMERRENWKIEMMTLCNGIWLVAYMVGSWSCKETQRLVEDESQ
jgi:hypothetical protein